mmetsp:Transcript_14428/g.33894  ORF Transcript_14428/g.33894 Transcript_14428/m.33894 type:complete len:267 (+) Transcript_14428:284-1084(+)
MRRAWLCGTKRLSLSRNPSHHHPIDTRPLPCRLRLRWGDRRSYCSLNVTPPSPRHCWQRRRGRGGTWWFSGPGQHLRNGHSITPSPSSRPKTHGTLPIRLPQRFGVTKHLPPRRDERSSRLWAPCRLALLVSSWWNTDIRQHWVPRCLLSQLLHNQTPPSPPSQLSAVIPLSASPPHAASSLLAPPPLPGQHRPPPLPLPPPSATSPPLSSPPPVSPRPLHLHLVVSLQRAMPWQSSWLPLFLPLGSFSTQTTNGGRRCTDGLCGV